MDELYTLDFAVLASEPLYSVSPIRALVFLFKWAADREVDDIGEGQSRGPRTGGVYDPDFSGFYAKQASIFYWFTKEIIPLVVQNACATLAIVNALGNIPDLPVGNELGDVFSFGVGMDPLSLGEVLTSSSDLRRIHNSLSPPAAISLDGLNLPKGEAEDAYHFVVYVPIGDDLYELDGLKRYAVNHGKIADIWVEKALSVIQQRIELYPAGSIEFNLQAIRPDPLPILSSSLPPELTPAEAQELRHEEEAKRRRWEFENALRRHNHLGLAIGLLQALAKVSVSTQVTEDTGGSANTLWEKTLNDAKEKMKVRIEKRREILAMAGKGKAIPEDMDLDA
ncbi:hypothetical protein FRC17_002416 [Serendipita sp. 399]|nr:hypothetical protein FRC17_002416 [Serendipita sp. 399]